jgi:hypothetical protein
MPTRSHVAAPVQAGRAHHTPVTGRSSTPPGSAAPATHCDQRLRGGLQTRSTTRMN